MIAAAILVWLWLFGQLVVWSAIVNAVWLDFRTARDAGEITSAAAAASSETGEAGAADARWEP